MNTRRLLLSTLSVLLTVGLWLRINHAAGVQLATDQRRAVERIQRGAASLVSRYPLVTGLLGEPVQPVCCVPLAFSNGEVIGTLTLSGSRGQAKLNVRGVIQDDTERFRELRVIASDGTSYDLLPDMATMPVSDLRTNAEVYFIPINSQKVDLQELVSHYQKKFGLSVHLLPSLNVPPAHGYNSRRKQWIAEDLLEAMRVAQPQLATDPHAVLIGITDDDIYGDSLGGAFTYSLRQPYRFAVVSTARMMESYWNPSQRLRNWISTSSREQDEAMRVRKLEQMVTKDIAVLLWHFPLNANPWSLLTETLSPDGGPDDLAISDLHPEQTIYGMAGSPCLGIPGRKQEPAARTSGLLSVDCIAQEPEAKDDGLLIQFPEGILYSYSSEFALDSDIPIVFQRVYHSGDTHDRAFGYGMTHSYDTFLVSDDPSGVNDAALIFPDGSRKTFLRDRNFAGVTMIDHADNDEYHGAVLSFENEEFHIKMPNGDSSSFFEQHGKLMTMWKGFRRPNGAELTIDRYPDRSLRRLSNGSAWAQFVSDGAGRVVLARTSAGKELHYEYDQYGCLTRSWIVGDATIGYEYNDRKLTAVISEGPPRQYLLRAAYDERGSLTRLESGGRIIEAKYNYGPQLPESELISWDDGRRFMIRRGPRGYTTWQVVDAKGSFRSAEAQSEGRIADSVQHSRKTAKGQQ